MDIGIRLRKYRIAGGYSQQFVADYLDISRNAYMAKEDNKVDISLQQALKICGLYDVSITAFLNINQKAGCSGIIDDIIPCLIDA